MKVVREGAPSHVRRQAGDPVPGRPRARTTGPATPADRVDPIVARKPKTPPKRVRVVVNRSGAGEWTEKWKSPKTGAWVYNYSAEFLEAQAHAKFEKNREFGRNALPRIRAQYAKDLGSGGQRAVIALVVALIDQAYFRVGGADNGTTVGGRRRATYGATTLLARHLSFQGNKAVFDFHGKKYVHQHVVIADPRINLMLRALKRTARRPNDPLFRYAGRPIRAADINAYLAPFGATAKNFRTYHATRLTRELLLERSKPGLSREERSAIVTLVVEAVAKRLGHTPAVCKGDYIDGRVIDAFMEGRLR